MNIVSNQAQITQQTVSSQAAVEKLAGTPLEPWAQTFIDLSLQYNIDLNWILAYMQWETGFGSAGPGGRHPSMDFNDPWDMLCATPGNGPGEPVEGATCVEAPNGYWYDAFPTMEQGIEAGYKNWSRYVRNGWSDWFTSLSVALCGNPNGCNGGWVDNVIAQGQRNAAQWPYVEPTDGPGPIIVPPEPTGNFTPVALLFGLGLLVGAAGLVLQYGGK